MRSIPTFILWLGLTLLASGQNRAHPTLSLEQAVKNALANSPLTVQSAALTQERVAFQSEVLAPVRPQLSITANSQYLTPLPALQISGQNLTLGDDLNYQIAATFRQTISDFGRSHHRLETAQLGTKIAEHRAIDIQRLVAAETARAYFETLSSQKVLTQSKAEIEARQELLRVSKVKVTEGVAAQFDLIRSRSDLADAEGTLISRRSTWHKKQARLFSLVGMKFQPLGPSELPQPPKSWEKHLARVLERADLEVLRLAIQQEESRGLGLSAGNNPTLAFQTQYLRQNPAGFNPNQQWSVGFQLQIPLLDGGLSRAQVRQSQARVEQGKARLRELERQVTVQVETSFLEFHRSFGQLEPAQRQLEEAKEAHRLSVLRYEAGLSTLLELLDTRAALSRAEVAVSTSELQLNLAWVDWAATTYQLQENMNNTNREESRDAKL